MIAAVQQAFPQVSIRQLCRWLGLGRTWYYTCPMPEERAARDVALRDATEQIILEFPGYGYRRVTHALHREGWAVNHKRVLRIMREEALLCQLRRQFVATTDSAHGYPTYPNRLADFVVTAPNQVWVADITYVRLPTTFVYLACVLDAFSRRCVGWHLSRQIDTQLTLAALEMALTQRATTTCARPHSPFRPWRPIRQPGLCHSPGTGRDPGQHVRQGQSL